MQRRILGVLAVALSTAMSGFAQEFRGTITGRVTDAQSASIPNAKITVTLISTISSPRWSSRVAEGTPFSRKRSFWPLCEACIAH